MCGAAYAGNIYSILFYDGSQAVANLVADTSATFYARATRDGVAAGSSVSLVGEVEDFSVDEVTDAELNRLSAASGLSVADIAAKPWRRFVPQRSE